MGATQWTTDAVRERERERKRERVGGREGGRLELNSTQTNVHWLSETVSSAEHTHTAGSGLPFCRRVSQTRLREQENEHHVTGPEDEAAALTTTAKSLTEPIDPSQDNSGSGEGRILESSDPPITSTQGFLTSVTQIRTDSLSTGTSDSPHSSIAQSHNDTLVSDSYSPTSSSIRNTLFTNSPTSTSTPGQNATHTHPPRGTPPAAGPSVGATTQHLPEENTDKEEAEDFTGKIYLTIAPETTVPTVLTWAEVQTTTTTPGLVETTLTSTHSLRHITPATSSETTFVRKPLDSTVGVTLRAGEATMTETLPTQSRGPLRTSRGNHYCQWDRSQISARIHNKHNPEPKELPGKEDKEDEEGVVPSADWDGHTTLPDVSTPYAKLLTTSPPQSTETPTITLDTEDWMSNEGYSDSTLLPDCNQERSGICNLSELGLHNLLGHQTNTKHTVTNQTDEPFLIPAPPMLVPLYTDWNSAMAAWGLAWDVHVYGAGCIFAMLTLACALNLLCLPLRCPSGCGYFALVSLFLLAAGCTRSFSLLYDAYGHQDRLPSTEASLILYEAPFPCLTAAFGLVFLLLSMRSRMQLSYSAFQRPCFLACLVVLHFGAAFGPVTLLKFYTQKPPHCLFLALISRGAFVALASFLSVAYFVFYIYVRADSNTSTT
ncbi:hypothetical protein F7725_021630 [Dissostichus mawsoni]|uniref:Proline-rich transmembrane protein 3/4 domain-containing protein n=1 Tax=Dissostichus mawsoni TaxID=36200 RepID=A0A7J5ZDP2_DISMA|nr:hypothetical protein F7725_021630 [Dissostichus mawsoni]